MNLYETAFWTKKASTATIIFTIFLFSIILVVAFIGKVTQIINQPGPEKPQNGYGAQIVTPIRSSLSVKDFKPTFSIETPSGKLPSFDQYNNILNIYKLQEKSRNLASDALSRQIGSKLDFKAQPTITKDIIYFWRENGRNLTVNRQYNIFEYYVDKANPVPSDVNTFDINDSSTTFVNLINALGVTLPQSDNQQSYKVVGQYVDYDFNQKLATKSKQGNQSKYVRLNVTRSIIAKSSINEMVDFFDSNSNINSIVIPNIRTITLADIVLINNYNWNIDVTSNQTYQIKDVDSAFSDLSSQKYPLISAAFAKDETNVDGETIKSVNQLRILDIKLGYYLTKDTQLFIQPIYVFTCEGTTSLGDTINLTYYIPALL